MKLADEAIHIANELAKIQPDTIVESVIRRLATELQLQRKHYEHAIGLGKGTAESRESGTDDRGAGVQPGAASAGPLRVETTQGTGEGQ